MYSIAIGGFPHGSLVVLNRQNSPPAHQASSTSGGSLISGLKHSQACRNVLGVCFSQKFHSTAGRGHVVDGFYTLASAGGLRVFRPLCWGPAVRVLRRGIVLGAWVRETRTSFLTLVEITSKPWFSPSSAEAWPLECPCILVLAFLRATAYTKSVANCFPN